MNNTKEREKFDDYKMLDNYGFSDGVRGRFYEPKKLASEQKVPYQILINTLRRKELQSL